ncbi:MAG: hypothetical protein BAJALOKI1v1_230021 [Promethearchaeota archaeon]|nr:MAG: hypothetical protein BAJALOKI1v1_230021 [Candidatus Lokiarchaeota archaeon]
MKYQLAFFFRKSLQDYIIIKKIENKIMVTKRFIVQLGCGTDQHGHDNDCTHAAQKAIKNAISNNCLTGLLEICNLTTPKQLLQMKVHVKIGAPFPETIDKKKVLKAVPFGEKSIEIVKGGLVVKGVKIEELGDTSDMMIMCNAAVTVSIDE